MMAANYRRAPLVEAVIEFRLKDHLGSSDLGRVERRYARANWKSEDLVEFSVTLVGEPVSPLHRKVGRRFTSADGSEVVHVTESTIGLSALAPYPGWDSYLERMKKVYRDWRKLVGRSHLSRVGVRYVNRIDIPAPDRAIVSIDEYLTFTSNKPKIMDAPLRGWSQQVNGGILADKISVNLAASTVESPLIDHVSVNLDIDVFSEMVDVPQSDDDIWTLVELIRQRRTEIFEACMTDKLRDLIS